MKNAGLLANTVLLCTLSCIPAVYAERGILVVPQSKEQMLVEMLDAAQTKSTWSKLAFQSEIFANDAPAGTIWVRPRSLETLSQPPRTVPMFPGRFGVMDTPTGAMATPGSASEFLQTVESVPLPPGLSIRSGMSMTGAPSGPPAIATPNGLPAPPLGTPLPPMGRSPPGGPPIAFKVNWMIAF
jgi:hypothetical protein